MHDCVVNMKKLSKSSFTVPVSLTMHIIDIHVGNIDICCHLGECDASKVEKILISLCRYILHVFYETRDVPRGDTSLKRASFRTVALPNEISSNGVS